MNHQGFIKWTIKIKENFSSGLAYKNLFLEDQGETARSFFSGTRVLSTLYFGRRKVVTSTTRYRRSINVLLKTLVYRRSVNNRYLQEKKTLIQRLYQGGFTNVE